MTTTFRSRTQAWMASAALALLTISGSVLADPPSRVARLSYLGGDVSLQPAGFNEWGEARINRPLIGGDSLYTGRASRVELEVGSARLRLDERTSFRVLSLDDAFAQVELTAGTLNLNVRNLFDDQSYEIDTPNLALVVHEPGEYRVDIAPDGNSTMVTVFNGRAQVYGRNDSSFPVRRGSSYRFYDDRLIDYEVFDLPRQDDFDAWCYERSERYRNSISSRYVSEEVIGYADLDDYGTWSTVSTYGAIWYPSRVSVGWTPYRNGHWSWIDPWGWTWVDDAPWGFAPSHYGRWAYVGNRWGWVPGPRHVRPIYAPALVAFVGGGGFSLSISSGPVGWFPLGPRDIYVPWYQGSRNYFTNINVHNTTIVNNTYITNVYNNYSRGRAITGVNYAYAANARAYTAVPHDAFVNARSVERARVNVDAAQLSRVQVASRIQVAPTQRSFSGGSLERADASRVARSANFDRQVIARTAPTATRVSADERIRAIARNNNQPLDTAQMRTLAKPGVQSRDSERIQVVGRSDATATTRTPATSRVERAPSGSRVDAPASGTSRSSNERMVRGDMRNESVSRPRTSDTLQRTPVQRSEADVNRSAGRVESGSRTAVERSTASEERGSTVRAPQRLRSEADSTSTRAPVQRNQSTYGPERVERSSVQRSQPTQRTQSFERSEPARREYSPPQSQRESGYRAPQQQSAPTYRAPQQERAEPQRQVREYSAPRAEPQQYSQPRSAPQQVSPPQQRQPASNPQPSNRKSNSDSNDDGDSNNGRQRRERN